MRIAEICNMERDEAAEVMFAERWMEKEDAITEEEVSEWADHVEDYENDSKTSYTPFALDRTCMTSLNRTQRMTRIFRRT